jgi:DNA-directed RNA polymerase subunit L
VTTKDLQIKDITTDSFVVEQERDKIFPPNPLTNDYIEIMRLRPKISDDIPGEQIKFTAKFDFGTANENGSFNVVSCSTYANTPDPVAIRDNWLAVASTLKTQGKTQEQIEFEKKDWMLLTGQRYTKPDSFDFQVETVGQYDNRNIVFRATHIMLDRIAKFRENIQVTQETVIRPSETTLAHGFDITLENEGYTLGKAIEYILYEKHYTEHKGEKTIEYCGFLKPHPHTKHSIIRLGFISQVDRTIVVNYIIDACNELEKIYNIIANAFNDSVTEQ